MQNDRFVRVSGVPGGGVHSIAEDGDGNLGIANQDVGLIRLDKGNSVQQIPWAGLGHKDIATTLAADSVRGGL